MRQHAVSTKHKSGPTCSSCNQIEHRALNLTTSSPAFRLPTAHVIFVPSKRIPEHCVCILCKIIIPFDAQEFHLSGKRHARNMKRARGPRACVCSAPVPIPKKQPKILAARNRNQRLRIINERKNRRHRGSPWYKRRRRGRRSHIAKLMKLERVGLLYKYFRNSKYQASNTPEPPPLGPNARHDLAVRLSPLERFYAPPEKRPCLFDDMQYIRDLLALPSSPSVRGRVIWSNALPYIGRFIRHALAPPQIFETPGPTRRSRQEWYIINTEDTPAYGITKKKKPTQGSKSKLKPKRQAASLWHCVVCDRAMPSTSMEGHLQGRKHARMAKAYASKMTARRGVMVRDGVRSLRPHGGALRIVVR